MYFVFILVGIAFALENVGPLILTKLFPQNLVSPAPDVPVRPQRTGARNDLYVDEEMGNQTSMYNQVVASQSTSGSDGLVSSSSSATLASAPTPDSFDYDEFRRENEAVIVPAAMPEPMAVSQGVPDMFDDESVHA